MVETRPARLTWWGNRPRPFVREFAGGGEGSSTNDSELGLDAEGRVVLQQSDRGPRGDAYSWGENWLEIVALGSGTSPHVEHFNFEDGRLVEEIEIEAGYRAEEFVPVSVRRWFYDGQGRPVLAVETYESGYARRGGAEPDPHWRGKLYRFSYEADGELEQILWTNSHEGFAYGQGVEAAQTAALEGEATLFPKLDNVIYDGRTARIEHDLPPASRAFDGVAEPLADAFRRALRPQLGDLGGVELVLIEAYDASARAIVASSEWADRARRMGIGEAEMIDLLRRGSKGTPVVEVVDIAGPDLMRAMRRGDQALRKSGAGGGAQRALAADVAARLEASEWTGLASPPRCITQPPKPAQRISIDLSDSDDRAPTTFQAPTSRAQLTSMLLNAGLSTDEARIVSEDARWGLRIEGGGNGESRLGGAPVLSPGTPWPESGGRPHTHLATLVFDELPAFEDRARLPDAGRLSIFADLSDEGGVHYVEPGDRNRDLIRLLTTTADGPCESVAPPGPRIVEERIRFIPVLQLRSLAWGVGEYLLGLDALAEHAVEQLRERIAEGVADQVLGHPITIQDDPRARDEITLLRMVSDHQRGFSYQDGGDLHFYGKPEDIAAARWDQVTVLGSSH